MGDKKSEAGQSTQYKGHYCRICGKRKANQKFSGSGHAAHVCRACWLKSPERQPGDNTMNKLHAMMRRDLDKGEINWLKSRRGDSRPEVGELAKRVFETRLPWLARKEIKQKLRIKKMVFRIRGEAYDSRSGDISVNAEFIADRRGVVSKKAFDGEGSIAEHKTIDIGADAIIKLLYIAVHKRKVPFWDDDLRNELYCGPDIDLPPERLDDINFGDFEDYGIDADETDWLGNDGRAPDDWMPEWSVETSYTNRTEQRTKRRGYMPGPVLQLFHDLDSCFDEDMFDDVFDEDTDCYEASQ
jgi:hypothetical protein